TVRWLGVFESICLAVAYAHSQGVIHRDLKPGNVMIGAFGEVQVMDWGLGKILRPETASGRDETDDPLATTVEPRQPGAAAAAGGPGATKAASRRGTPAYMPPEQAAGAISLMDRRGDVFGLGGILCELLTGKPPFVSHSGDTARLLAARGKTEEAFARLDG